MKFNGKKQQQIIAVFRRRTSNRNLKLKESIYKMVQVLDMRQLTTLDLSNSSSIITEYQALFDSYKSSALCTNDISSSSAVKISLDVVRWHLVHSTRGNRI